MDMLNILIVATDRVNSGGVGSYISSITKNNQESNFYIAGNSNSDDLKLPFFELNIRYKATNILLSIRSLLHIIASQKIDIIHAHTQRAAFLCCLAKLFKQNIKIVYTPHGLRHTQLRTFTRIFHLMIEIFILLFVNKVTTLTITEKRQIPIFKNKAISLKSHIEVHESIPIRSEHFHMQKASTKIVMIGSLDKRKNPEFFIKVAKCLPNKRYSFLWVGDGELMQECQTQIHQLGLENIKFIGQKPRSIVYSILKDSDIFLMTSKAEGFPLCILEAFFFKTAVISSEFLGVDEIITQGKTGWIYKDVDQACTLIKNWELSVNREKIVDEANTFVRDFVCRNEFQRRFNDVYRKI